MSRAHQEQSAHDRKVSNLAWSYNGNGYDVSADVSGYPQPALVFGKRPDLIVEKWGQRTIIEVETASTKNSKQAREQAEAFARAEREWANTSFLLEVI